MIELKLVDERVTTNSEYSRFQIVCNANGQSCQKRDCRRFYEQVISNIDTIRCPVLELKRCIVQNKKKREKKREARNYLRAEIYT